LDNKLKKLAIAKMPDIAELLTALVTDIMRLHVSPPETIAIIEKVESSMVDQRALIHSAHDGTPSLDGDTLAPEHSVTLDNVLVPDVAPALGVAHGHAPGHSLGGVTEPSSFCCAMASTVQGLRSTTSTSPIEPEIVLVHDIAAGPISSAESRPINTERDVMAGDVYDDNDGNNAHQIEDDDVSDDHVTGLASYDDSVVPDRKHEPEDEHYDNGDFCGEKFVCSPATITATASATAMPGTSATATATAAPMPVECGNCGYDSGGRTRYGHDFNGGQYHNDGHDSQDKHGNAYDENQGDSDKDQGTSEDYQREDFEDWREDDDG
jgi:hypothetical protein